MTKIKNKMYQPLPLIIDGKTVVVGSWKSIEVEEVTPQMISLKAQGLVQVIRK